MKGESTHAPTIASKFWVPLVHLSRVRILPFLVIWKRSLGFLDINLAKRMKLRENFSCIECLF
ncbi:unnamed protein product [Meloidogyne enterolobii]|uniref:Uncharacterized protein n=1 Tax=Meloidogyne enterolobii TaxID=390850 RepID=A0ACB0Y8I1_MELEN